MKLAILSDIHANDEALTAVLRDLHARGGADRVYCLGDVVGYGPRPVQTLNRAKQFDLVLTGNHEAALVNGPKDFNPMAARAIYWTYTTLFPDVQNLTGEQQENWAFISTLQKVHKEGPLQFIHGAPQDPVEEYILPMDIDPMSRRYGAKLTEAFRLTDWLSFIGHSHYPGVFSDQGEYIAPTPMRDFTYPLQQGTKYIINVGSVGQPRDGDNRACYAIYEDGRISWRRVAYDIQETYNHIYAIEMLDDILGERLFRGE